MGEESNIPVVDRLKLNAIKDPEELVQMAGSHKNPQVCKAAIDRIMKMDLVEERKALLIFSVVKRTDKEEVAAHAFGLCLVSKLQNDVQFHMIKGSIEKIKFESIKMEMRKFLEKHK